MAKTRKVRSNKNVIGPLKKNELVNLGYSTKKSDTVRHRALNKSVKKYGALKTFRKLNAVATLNKNRAPSVSKVMLTDRNWVRKTHMKSTRKKGGKRGIGLTALGLAVRSAPTAARFGYRGARLGANTLSALRRAQKGKHVNTGRLAKNAKSFGSSGAKLVGQGTRFFLPRTSKSSTNRTKI
jgi:hypothetical protein